MEIPSSLENGPMGRCHSIQVDGMGEAAAGVPQRHWLHAEEREIKKETERERKRGERPRREEEEEEEGGEEEQEEEGAEEEEKIQRRIGFGLERGRLGTGSAGSSKISPTLPRLEAMQRPSPPTEEEDTWQYDPIDPNKISPMKLKEFNAKVKSLPFYVTFEEAWDKHDLVEFFFTTSENKEEIHQLFRKARFPLAPHAVNQPPSPPSSPHPSAKVQPTFKTLYKIEDPGQFSIPCQVNGHYFDRTLCDSGSCINLMPTQTAKLLGITRLQPAQISIGLANHTIAKPRGVVIDVLLEIGDIKIPVDFHVINIQGGCDTPLILGRPFLATAGAVMDLPNRRMSLTNVDKTVFYKTIPFIAPNKLSYLITAQGRPREPPDHTQGHNETRTKRLCLRPCPYPISN
ncbi:unnamed protein product [Microthlaspi erraticum]|uniref:Aspartic peptidase DDI1-type domain-containing protein n=1 Tax=Microthlaspi erraticum TaxID=1685480 RepID=A0A6D2JW29_9BRAS|nr:unnamed protein product [Microthlaspi erraticum]